MNQLIFRSVFIIILSAATAVLADDWPQYRGIHGDGKTAEVVSGERWPADGPRQLWKAATPKGFSSFSVADGRAFTLIAEADSEGMNRETCIALNAESGERLWSVALGSSDYEQGGGDSGAEGNRGGDGPRSTPSTDGRHVFVYDSHMALYCFDAKTGTVQWQTNLIDDYAGRKISWLNAASPLLSDSLLFVSGGGAEQSFLAFDKVSGEVVWKSGDETMTHATPVFATLGNVRQVVFFAKSGLVSVDRKSGQEQWRTMFPYSTSTAASPVIHGDLVYCSAGYGVGAGLFRIGVSVAGYAPEDVWQKPNELMNHWSTPIYLDGHLYGIFGFKKYGKAPLQCVELSTGEIKWSENGFGPGNCILAGDKLLILSDDGHLVMVEANSQSYSELNRAKVVQGKCWSTPGFSNGRIYVRSTVEGACLEL